MMPFAIDFEFPAQVGLVSVVIPTFNRSSSVRRAINSALAQSYRELEVIVVDDGSTDDTSQALRGLGPRVRVFSQANAGPAAARNTGMARARGEFVAFLDSDDVWLDWKIEAQVRALGLLPNAGLAWTDMIAIDDEGRVRSAHYLREMYGAYSLVDFPSIMPVCLSANLSGLGPAEDAMIRVGDLSTAILFGNLLHTPTVLIRRAWINVSGGFDPSYRNGGEDYEFYTRVCALGAVVLLEIPAVEYRVGGRDQLTAPEKLVHLAYNDLRAVSARMAEPQRRRAMGLRNFRNRLAECHAWIGSAELERGQRCRAIKHLVASVWYRPRLDHRGIVLIRSLLPSEVVRRVRVVKQSLR